MKRDSLIVIFILLVLAWQWLQLTDVSLPYMLTSYLDDVLIVPLVYALIHAASSVSAKIRVNESKRLPYFLALYFFMVFEGIVPLFHKGFTADIWDGLAYLIGAMICSNKPYLLNFKALK
jgi:hypothetical protein